jgi:hypothetical protein
MIRRLGASGISFAKQAEPIRAQDAFRAITVEDDANVIELRDAAVIATEYLLALRRSELVGLDYGKHGDGDGVLSFSSHACPHSPECAAAPSS